MKKSEILKEVEKGVSAMRDYLKKSDHSDSYNLGVCVEFLYLLDKFLKNAR